MSEATEQQRQRYYFQFMPPSPGVDASTLTQAEQYLNRTMANARRDPRVRPFQAMDADTRGTYMLNAFGTATPRGIGVRQGEFASLPAEQLNDETRFLATDYLLDCHALVLIARDAEGRVLRTALGHLDMATDLPVAVRQMMEQMPTGAAIEATVLGSPQGYNHYLQADLMQQLLREPRVTSIRHDFDGASTVAVDTRSGRILTASPAETMDTAYTISELPVAITFPPVETEGAPTLRNLSSGVMRQRLPWPDLPLHAVYDPAQHAFQPRDALGQFIAARQQSDGQLNAQELREIATEIGRVLRRPVGLQYERQPEGFFKIEVRDVDSRELGFFFSNALEPTLGTTGAAQAL